MRLLTKGLFLLGAYLAFASCEECNSKTCATGCCDAEGQCVSGRSPIACGGDGALCSRCNRSEVCTSQQCVARPDGGQRDAGIDAGHDDAGGFVVRPCLCPTGCCTLSGQCESGLRPDACGTDGGTCVSCRPEELCRAFVCTPLRCDGCALGDGRCAPGSLPSTCGADGGLCVACLPGQSCTRGTCIQPVCGPQTCAAGCCSNGLCVAGAAATACGKGGTSCQSCDGGCIDGGCR